MTTTTNTKEMCLFNGDTLAAFCETGCCGNGCCSSSGDGEDPLTYAVMACIAILIFIFIVFVIIYLCLRNRGYCQQRPDDPEDKQPLHSRRRARAGGFFGNWKLAASRHKKKTAGVANPVFDWAGRLKEVVKDSKETQTGEFHKLPGDSIINGSGWWLPYKRDKNAPRDMRENIRDVGVNTVPVKNNAKQLNNETKKSLPPPREVKPASQGFIPSAAPRDHSFHNSDHTFGNATMTSPERQNTIDMLNDFTKHVMKPK